jgi:prepilin-type N-terminal cleavage/methylation domain-containing protein
MKKPSGVEMKSSAARAGFTLIELLTVIAIIAILAGMTAVAVPRYLEKAQVTKAKTNLENVAKALAAKSAESGNTTGYPVAYGFVLPEAREVAPATLLGNPQLYYQLRPYTVEIGLHQDVNVYELPRWMLSAYDSDNNGQLGLLEYSPIGEKDSGTTTYAFSAEIYSGPNGEFPGVGASNNPLIVSLSEATLQSKDGIQRPFVYVPFNKRQLSAVRRYWTNQNDEFAATVDASDPDLQGRLFFPPPNYDGFVLVGNGPGGTNGGVVADPPANPANNVDPAYVYHMAALRTAFLATRDWDRDGAGPGQPDGKLDFDFEARREAQEMNMLPDGTNGQGAFIKVVQ